MDESRIADPSSALRRSDRSLPTRLSRAVSVVLHPLVMPLCVILLPVSYTHLTLPTTCDV